LYNDVFSLLTVAITEDMNDDAIECMQLQQIQAPCTTYHQAMKQPDKEKFIQAAWEEINAHTKNRLWSVVKRSKNLKAIL
jgi:hypothetical protein